MRGHATTPAIACGDALHSPYPSLADALLDGIAKAGGGHFLSIRADGRPQRMCWQDSLARAWKMVAALQAERVSPGAALVLRLREADEIVTAIHAGILGGYVIVPMTGRLEQPLPPAVLAHFGQLVDIDPATFLRLCATPAPTPDGPQRGEAGTLRFGITTSGTTGAPRLVGLSDAAALARWWPRMPQASHAKGFLSWTSFDHVMGIGMAMPDLPVKVHLATQRFISTPLSWLDTLVDSGATHATTTSFGLDLVVQALARAPDRSWDLRHVQRIGIGAETVSRATAEAALRALTPFGLREDALIAGYGLSECGPVAGGGTSLMLSAHADEAPPELDRPTAGHAVRIVAPDGGVLNEGDIGAIEVRGPTMTSGYIGDAEANRQLFTADHWLRTGDLGLLRQGRLTVTGRAKELIVVHARKVACQEIEAVLRQATGQRELYAAPLADPPAAQGAPCGIFVVDDTDSVPPDLAETIARAMAKAFRFVPARISLLPPELVPRTASGKVRRLDLPQVDRPNIACRAAHADASSDDFEPLTTVWRDILQQQGWIDPDADFFLLGGDSLMAVQLAAEVERLFGRQLNFEDFPETLSLRALNAHLGGRSATPAGRAAATPWRDKLLQRMHDWPGTPGLAGGLIRHLSGGRTPQDAANLFWCAQTAVEANNLGEALSSRVNTFALRSGAQLFRYGTPESRAAAVHYAEEIQRLAPFGPLILGGNCQGATLMREIIPLLHAAGREIALFVIADAHFLRLSQDQAFDVPIALIALSGSKFNPQRWFKHSETGLRKFAPRGLMFKVVPGRYTEGWRKPNHVALGEALVQALHWARGPLPPLDLPAPQPVESSFYNYRIRSNTKTLRLWAGETRRVKVRLTNMGGIPWRPFEQSGLALGNHWMTEEGELLTWADGRCALPAPVACGETIALTLHIRAPHRTGPALLEVDLAEEGVRWFADVNGPALQIRVLVKEAPKPRNALAALIRAGRHGLKKILG